MIVPIFGCEDIEKAGRFYEAVMGFKALANFRLDPEKPDPAYRTMEFRGSHLHISSFPGNQGSANAAYVYIDEPEEVDRLYETVSKYPDIEINIPLCDQSWGMREFAFRDGFGNCLHVGAQISDVAPSSPVQ